MEESKGGDRRPVEPLDKNEKQRQQEAEREAKIEYFMGTEQKPSALKAARGKQGGSGRHLVAQSGEITSGYLTGAGQRDHFEVENMTGEPFYEES